MQLDKWQKEVLEHDGNTLLCTGRQVGKTTIFAQKAAEYMIKHANARIIAVSLTEDQAFLMKVMVQDYLEKHYKTYLKVPKRKKPTKNRIALNNRSEYVVRPVGNSGDAVRGFTGDVLIVDEAGSMPEQMWAAAKPALASTGGQIWMCSTPRGKEGYFYECWLNKAGKYRVWHKNTLEVYEERKISRDWTGKRKKEALEFLEWEKQAMSELEFGQEYLGLFLEDLRQFFPDKLLDQICTLKRPDKVIKEGNVLGVDVARMGNDECAYAVLNRNNQIRQIENLTAAKQLTTKTEADILNLNKMFNAEKIGIDAGAGSLGVGIYDRLLNNIETKRKVIAMNNRQVSMDRDGKKKQRIFKEDLYENLLNMMEKSEIKLLDDSEIYLSLKGIQIEIDTKSGIRRYRIFGRKGKGGDHIAEALVRAAWLAKKEKSKNFHIYYV